MKRLLCCMVLVGCVAIAGCGSSANRKGAGGSGGSSGGGGSGAGGTNGDTCSVPAPCGGNIVGTWRILSACGSIASSACPPSQTISVHTSWAQVTYTFASDGTVSLAGSGPTTEVVRYPIGCLSAIVDAGASEACATFEHLIQTSLQNPDAGPPNGTITSFTCSMDGSDACLCNEVVEVTTQMLTDTYTTSGNQITFINASADAGSGASDSHGEYCVSGNTLTIHVLDATGATSEFLMTLTRVN